MTQASDIMCISSNANDADDRARELTNNLEQDWDRKATLYTFGDESVLVINGWQLSAYASIEDARDALNDDWSE